jgi:hypothetical protein
MGVRTVGRRHTVIALCVVASPLGHSASQCDRAIPRLLDELILLGTHHFEVIALLLSQLSPLHRDRIQCLVVGVAHLVCKQARSEHE